MEANKRARQPLDENTRGERRGDKVRREETKSRLSVNVLESRGRTGGLGGRWGIIGLDGLGGLLVVDVQPEGDHAVDALGEASRLIEHEARDEEGRLEEEEGQVADRLVCLVLGNLLLQLLDDRVLGVEFERLLRSHVV